MNIIGSLGGSNVTDKALIGVAPAFRGVRNLGLQARGFAGACFTPQGLRTFADKLEGLEFFALDYFTLEQEGKTPLPPLGEYVDVVTSHAAFKSLRAVVISGARQAQLEKLPNLVTAITHGGYEHIPGDARSLALLTRR